MAEQEASAQFTYSVGECAVQGQTLATHTWTPTVDAASWRGVVVVFHGYAAHGAYPTVRFGGELVAGRGNFVCMSVDFPGHGGSPGLPGFIADHEDLTSCGTEFFEHVQATHPQLRCFLMGTSMGGAIALNVSLRVGLQCSGMALLAPMCRIAPEAMPPAWQVPLLKAASYLCPRWAVIPSAAADDDAQYKDAERY
jgi:alpha-beta hydrolase superfamily lysophospholipase